MRLLFFIVLSTISLFAFSANESIPKNRTISELIVYEKLVVVKISPGFTNSQNCSASSTSLLQLNFNDETGNNTGLLSTLLAAAAAGKKVGFGIGDCAGQYPKIYRVDVQY